MNKFEKLLDKDPIGAFNKIKDNYIRYFKTMYKFQNQELEDKKNTELVDESKENIYKEPYLEILPEYSSAKLDNGNEVGSIEDLIPIFSKGFNSHEDGESFIKKFIKPGLMSYPPYGHQVEMYTNAFEKGRNTVITSGTGSGKTESFLLPLFGELYKEAKTWTAPNYECDNWFEGENGQRKKYNNTYQRLGEIRTSAVRAMIMYPMNALVEDQMTRLRKALDCDGVREYFDSDEGLKGNRIYFGRYNGQTIGKKGFYDTDTADHKKCQKEINKLITDSLNILSHAANNPNDEDAKYIAPRLSANSRTSEMITRWDMQKFPPDILISNFSMLSIMLMRKAEASIFEKTKDWLAENKNNVFHLIIDELHLFRGTSGTELAYLMRMFFDAIGIEPVVDDGNGGKKPNNQLRILASSASLGNEDQTQKFLEEFFGVYNTTGANSFSIQKGTDYNPITTKQIDYTKFELINADYPFLNDQQKIDKKNELASEFNYTILKDFFENNAEIIFADFKEATKIVDQNGIRYVPKKLEHIKNTIFNGNENALRGFLIIRADLEFKNLKLPRIRFHQFFKYIEGLWAELLPQLPNQPQQPFGQLMYQAQEVYDNGTEMHKVLELLRCEGCGTSFIGGNANRVQNRVTLSLNSPELEKIPNRNPTPMVQNKWFHEYAIFWPTEKLPEDQNSNFFLLNTDGHRDDFHCTNKQGINSFGQTNLRANWQKAAINPYNGEIKRGWNGDNGSINGYVFNLINQAQNNNNNGVNAEFIPTNYLNDNPIQALPHKCPSCSRDYTNRKYTKSPIRSFRTGISRSNQLLSKELIYQLSGDKPKLVGFSDSRQDAADQAFGIEQEHYRDMLRMLFLECIDELTAVNPRISNLIDRTVELEGAIFQIIEQEYGDILNRNDIAIATLANSQNARQIYLNPQDHFNLIDLIDVNDGELNGILIQKLLKLGINPAGVEFEKQFINGNHWSCLYEIKVDSYKLKSLSAIQLEIGTLPNYDAIKTEIKQNIFASIYQNSFGKFMALDTESTGIGYISFKLNQLEVQNLQNILPAGINAIEFMNAFLRVLGDHYMYPDPDSGFDNELRDNFNALSASIRKPIETFCNRFAINLNNLVDQLNLLLEQKCSPANIILNPNHLQYTRVSPTSNYYKCSNCSKIHLYKGMGLCTNTQCLMPISDIPTGIVNELNYNNYIGFDLLVEKRNAIRLHTEELTGQTDNQALRQLEFKGIILDNNNQYRSKLTKEIDMINVTTTMEVGIDIGSLQAIFQGNMPPTRYNYQQRVGRGGRRGQAYSCAVTFCRGKSHDNYYYHSATDEMLGSVPPAPTLSIAPHQLPQGGVSIKTSIARRILTKNILKIAFNEFLETAINQYNNQNQLLPTFSDTHGEFGHVLLWNNILPLLSDWITNNHNLIEKYIAKYLSQFNANGQIQDNVTELFTWFTINMIDDLDAAYNQRTKSDGLAEVFAEAGFLPMFGMPSSTRVMYHGIDKQSNELRTIDRPVEQSITEFAPGAIKTKDKGFYESVGLTIPMKYTQEGNITGIYSSEAFDNNQQNYQKLDALEYSYNLNLLEDGSIDTISEYKPEENPLIKRLVVPKAFRTLKIKGNTGAASDNSDTRSKFSSASIFALEEGTPQPEIIGNCKISLFGVLEDTKGEIWHINDNNRNYFKGKSIKQNFQYIDNNWINDEPKIRNGAGHNFFPNFIIDKQINQPNYQTFEGDIALGVKKTTEMIKIEINQIPAELCLNVNCLDNNNASAIKSAFYSAAFILQRSLAHNLDIQPNEIEISELKINPTTGVPYLYLSDSLPNGAGFVSYLLERSNGNSTNLELLITDIIIGDHAFIRSIVNEQHINQCKTSCQKCLNSYDNSGYHHILDWRLGIGLLRLLIDEDFNFGYNADVNYPELFDLQSLINESTITYGKILDKQILESQNGFKYISDGNAFNQEYTFIKHPLWDVNSIAQNCEAFLPGITINRWLNLFELLRKPASSY